MYRSRMMNSLSQERELREKRQANLKLKSELNEIQSEGSETIAAIRDEIEKASHLYNEAEKKFKEAEKIYNSALEELVKSKEQKAILIDRLYDEINESDLKKAKRLSEFIGKLETATKQPLPSSQRPTQPMEQPECSREIQTTKC